MFTHCSYIITALLSGFCFPSLKINVFGFAETIPADGDIEIVYLYCSTRFSRVVISLYILEDSSFGFLMLKMYNFIFMWADNNGIALERFSTQF